MPLDRTEGGAPDAGQPIYVPRKREPRPEPPPPPRVPPRFKVVDVMTARTLLEGADGRAVVDLLKTVRSVVDVRISIWNAGAGAWRVLSPREQHAIWELRDR